MPSIVGKKQGNKTYYYLVESARVGGKPRIVSQRYLGPAEEIVARLTGAGAGEPDRTRHLAFGDVAAVWGVLEALRVAETVDEVVGARRADAAASVGTYIALATLNRVAAPVQACFFRLVGQDCLRPVGEAARRRPRPPALLAGHGPGRRGRAGRDRAPHRGPDGRGLRAGPLRPGPRHDKLRHLHRLGQRPGPIAQRGHAKQKRADLRIIGLGLVVSTDGGVPLVSHAYPGNLPDVSQFKTMLDELVARFGALGGDAGQLTLVFDAGQNSADNFGLFEGSPLHFVGSLPPSDHLDLLAVAKSRYRPLDQGRFPGLSAFETKKAVFGTERRIVVTHSQTLHDRQSAGFDQTLAKAARQLGELQARLERGQTAGPGKRSKPR